MSERRAGLVAIEEIRALKARYFRLMDTKQWDAWADVFTVDCVFEFPEGGIAWHGRDRIVAECRNDPRGSITVHHGHMPEIELTSATTATGVWAMHDDVEFTRPDDSGIRGFEGFGHYHETYEKGDDGRWRIDRLLLTRLRVDPR
jgi:SnoaL-like domain